MPREHQSEEKLKVDLFICPEPGCRLIGKRPITDLNGTYKGWCKGPRTAPHKKRKMALTRFVEAPK